MRELSIEEICSVSGAGGQECGDNRWQNIGINTTIFKFTAGQAVDAANSIINKIGETILKAADIPPSQVTKNTKYSILSSSGSQTLGQSILPYIAPLEEVNNFGNL